MAEAILSQNGIIEQITDNAISVRIECSDACSACHSRNVCLSTEKRTKHVSIEPDGNSYSVGQHVTVYCSQRNGYKALMWGYVLPLMLVVVSLIILLSAGVSESKAGLTSILLLVPYYLVLFLLRANFKKNFVFKIKE